MDVASEYRKRAEAFDEGKARRDEAIGRLADAGFSLRSIAKGMGISHQTVLNVLRAREARASKK